MSQHIFREAVSIGFQPFEASAADLCKVILLAGYNDSNNSDICLLIVSGIETIEKFPCKHTTGFDVTAAYPVCLPVVSHPNIPTVIPSELPCLPRI